VGGGNLDDRETALVSVIGIDLDLLGSLPYHIALIDDDDDDDE